MQGRYVEVTYFSTPKVSSINISGSQVMGLIDSVVSCQELCDSIVAEAETVINERLANSVTQTADER